MTQSPIVQMRGISKHFGNVHANDAVDFTLQRGEIHAIVGENGAGKSTLMKILYGLYQPDSGEISVNDKSVNISSPRDAMRHGLGMIQQHFTLIPAFTSLQNIILGKETCKFGTFLDYQKAETVVTELAQNLGFDVPLNTPIESLPIGTQQHTEILKVLYHGAEILIMDEPTAVLVPQEIQGLFTCMRGLKQEGKSIIIITHKLDEVMEIADTVTVMRSGKMIATLPITETHPHQLAELMIGESVSQDTIARKEITHPTPILQLEDVTTESEDDTSDTFSGKLDSINLDVYSGEIVGIAGVEGNGQTELIEVLTGLRQIQDGKIALNGESMVDYSTAEFREKLVAHLPADRHRHGVSLNSRIDENFIVGKHKQSLFSRNVLLRQKNIRQFALNALDKYQIKLGSISDKMKTLSGGNQQKVVVARELSGDPTLIIAAHPTRGLDVHAAKFVHERLIQARNRQKAVIVVSAELDELFYLSDRIVVMYKGHIAGIVKPEETNQQKLGALMLGVNENDN